MLKLSSVTGLLRFSIDTKMLTMRSSSCSCVGADGLGLMHVLGHENAKRLGRRRWDDSLGNALHRSHVDGALVGHTTFRIGCVYVVEAWLTAAAGEQRTMISLNLRDQERVDAKDSKIILRKCRRLLRAILKNDAC